MRSSRRAAAEARGPWAGRRAGLAPGCDPALARPPREVSGRRPPSASSRLPPERSPRCTLGAGARAARPGRADPAGGRGAGRSVSAGGAGEADRYSLRGEGAMPPLLQLWRGRGTSRREGGSGRWDAGAQLRCGRTAVALGNAGPGAAEGGGARPASGSARAGPAGCGGCPGLGGGRAWAAEGRGPGAAHACGPVPPGLAILVRAHARCPPEASGRAERARAARRRTCEVFLEERAGGWVRGARGLGRLNPSLGSASRPSRARAASDSGDEGALAHPAQSAAAAGRLHCLTTTRAASDPDLQIQETLLSGRQENLFLKIEKEDW